jgi:glyoxylase-like metal-dependent hydrolase (beta-lactamase superfamily II)
MNHRQNVITALALALFTLAACRGDAPAGKFKYVETGFTKSYLVPCRGGYLLVDTSYPDKYGEFAEKLGRLNIAAGDIKYLLLTHHHDDHAGFAAELVKKTGARIIVHRDALPYLARGTHDPAGKTLNACISMLTGVFALVHDWEYPPLRIRGTDIVVRGDDSATLGKIGVDARIIRTPGHSDDSITVLFPDGSALVGDAAMDLFGFCGCKRRPIFLKDMKQVYGSWKKLIDLGAKTIYPAHSKPFSVDELAETMEEAPGA